MVINKCLVGLLVSCFKLLVCTYKGTSSFMTSALDALVFVKVCSVLHRVSQMVSLLPGSGRGVETELHRDGSAFVCQQNRR